jgi:hypothetical protein
MKKMEFLAVTGWVGMSLFFHGGEAQAKANHSARQRPAETVVRESAEVYGAHEGGEKPIEIQSAAPVRSPSEQVLTEDLSARPARIEAHLKNRIAMHASWGTFDMIGLPAMAGDRFGRASGAGMAIFLDGRYWLTNAWSMRFRSGYIDPQVVVHSVRGEALAGAVPAYVSAIYDFGIWMQNEAVHPYISLGTGALIGRRNDGEWSAQTGLIPEVGIELLLNQRFMLGMGFGGQWMTGQQSAWMLNVGVGYVFGKI